MCAASFNVNDIKQWISEEKEKLSSEGHYYVNTIIVACIIYTYVQKPHARLIGRNNI